MECISWIVGYIRDKESIATTNIHLETKGLVPRELMYVGFSISRILSRVYAVKLQHPELVYIPPSLLDTISLWDQSLLATATK